MIVSIETPVFKGGWLQRCIDSVLYQSSPHWRFSLLWDGGDDQSRRILEDLEQRKHPNVTVHFGENRGIARARRFLTEHSEGEMILPLDDDDTLPFNAVERFLAVAEQKPWSSVVRARRKFIGEDGKIVEAEPWFPFGPRQYQHGMVTDLFNHSQPYLIRRRAYERTSGWEGFEDFHYAGEDCDLYLKLEEVGTIELLDEVLYYYRIHGERASLVLTDEAAFEMWRRLADKTIVRLGLPLRRSNDKVPYHYERVARTDPTLNRVDFVIISDGDASRISVERIALSLKRADVADDAVRVVTRDGARHLEEGLRETVRPLICFLDASVEIDGTESIEILLGLMTELEADLVGPKLVNEDGFILCADPGFGEDRRPASAGAGEFDEGQYNGVTNARWLCEKVLLLRREVTLAVGGIDPGYEHERTAMVDFCLRARQRDFKCCYIGAVEFTSYGSDVVAYPEADGKRLDAKWVDFPHLFAR